MIEAVMTGKDQDCFFHGPVQVDADVGIGALRAEASLIALPPAVERINRLLGSAPVDLRRLGESIKDAPSLADEAVRLSNASLFGLSQPVASLEQAVIIMGAEIVRTLVLTCWLTQYTGANVPTSDNRMFWSHSLLVAQLSRHICEWAGYAQPEWAFLAGLFHDAGNVPFLTLLGRHRTSSGPSLFEAIEDSVEAQRRRFRTDHCELGLQVGASLDLSPALVDVMARHHQRGAMLSHMPLVCLVGAAEVMAQGAAPLAKQDGVSLPQVQLIRNALSEFMPGLTPEAGPGLVKTLEADLNGVAGPPSDAADPMRGANRAPATAGPGIAR